MEVLEPPPSSINVNDGETFQLPTSFGLLSRMGYTFRRMEEAHSAPSWGETTSTPVTKPQTWLANWKEVIPTTTYMVIFARGNNDNTTYSLPSNFTISSGNSFTMPSYNGRDYENRPFVKWRQDGTATYFYPNSSSGPVLSDLRYVAVYEGEADIII